MNPFSGKSVQIYREGGGESLSFTCLHFSDLSLMKNNPSYELSVKMTHLEGSDRGLAHHGKCLREEVVERFAVFEAFTKTGCHRLEFIIGQSVELGVMRINMGNDRGHFLEFPLVLASKHLFEQITYH